MTRYIPNAFNSPRYRRETVPFILNVNLTTAVVENNCAVVKQVIAVVENTLVVVRIAFSILVDSSGLKLKLFLVKKRFSVAIPDNSFTFLLLQIIY